MSIEWIKTKLNRKKMSRRERALLSPRVKKCWFLVLKAMPVESTLVEEMGFGRVDYIPSAKKKKRYVANAMVHANLMIRTVVREFSNAHEACEWIEDELYHLSGFLQESIADELVKRSQQANEVSDLINSSMTNAQSQPVGTFKASLVIEEISGQNLLPAETEELLIKLIGKLSEELHGPGGGFANVRLRVGVTDNNPANDFNGVGFDPSSIALEVAPENGNLDPAAETADDSQPASATKAPGAAIDEMSALLVNSSNNG